MSANVTIYCLEDITDYFGLERVCHDLMARKGYSKIEPLGGFKDKGRDAVHTSQAGTKTVFAYSVREDWRAKLAEDAAKIDKHGHACDELVFLTTARFSAGERDQAVADIANQYGWQLELYGVERLRILLDVDYPDIRALHPHIFLPQFYAPMPAISPTTPHQEHLFISAAPEDRVFANWLTQKLTAEGYRVWWEGLTLLGGESYPDDVDAAIRERACRVIGVYSLESLSDPEVMRQRNLALSIARERKSDFLIPLNVNGVEPRQLDRITAGLTFIPFQANWAVGLKQLLQKLDAVASPKPLLTGRTIAASAFLEEDVLSEKTEPLFSNCLTVEHLPPLMLRFEAKNDLAYQDLLDLRLVWAFRKITPKVFLSFHEPNSALMNRYGLQLTGSKAWATEEWILGVRVRDLMVELIRKALVVKCHQKGLMDCPTTHLQYFPQGLVAGDRLKFTRPDGGKTHVLTTGQRKYWRPTGSQDYKYYLAPVFSVAQWPFDDYTVMVTVRVRITDEAGNIYPKRTGNARRKHLCRDWWNHEWINRMLAICQFLANAHGKISIGDCLEEELLISAAPLALTAPFSINEQALDQRSFERSEELLPLGDDGDDEVGEQEAVHE
jgi:hypothetical protein